MLSKANKFWQWLLVSSSDPTKESLTVKGWVSAILPILMFTLHNPNLSDLPNEVYAALVAVFAVVSAVATAWGLLRKVYFSFRAPEVPPSA